MNNPIVTKFLNEVARTRNERQRFLFRDVEDLLDWYDAHVESALDGVNDSDVIDDGRDDVTPITVGDFKRWVAYQRFLRLLSSHRGNEDQNQLQNGFNAFVNANINVRQLSVLFTVRTGLFGN